MGRFEGLTILVTGATGGFGRRLCERLAEAGAQLVLSDVDAGPVQAFAETLPTESVVLGGDVSQEKLSEELVALAVKRFGRLDIAINNAGVAQSFVRLPQVPSEEARRIIDIDLMGVFFAMKHQLPQMERQHRQTRKGGAIVNIASVAGLVGAPRLSVYAAAKHGVVGLTRSAAAEYATKGIRVNAVCPAFARTRMVDDFVRMTGKSETDAIADLTRGVPMKRVAEVDEVVEVILFAADPANSFMTGHTLSVDGGISAI
jgi:NAD(P)-dependent dehydrogenase (short-subunit alcohol dehydrogenase family)